MIDELSRGWALCVLGACWTSAPPPVAAPPVVRRVAPPPELELQPANDLGQLSHFLRASHEPIAALVDGPVVAVDIAANTVATLCGAPAEDVVRRWTAPMRDPGLSEPWCRQQGDGYTACISTLSTDPYEILILYLRYTDRWHLAAMISGQIDHTTGAGVGLAIGPALAAAKCP